MRAIIREADLFYLTHGRKTPVLLFHGGPGLDHTYFRPWLDGLADSATLIYFDLRGNGRSSGREDLGAVSLESWAADADALREHLGFEQVVVFGHGYGGFLAQTYAKHYRDRTLGLALCAATTAWDYPEVMMQNAVAQCTQEQLALLVSIMTREIPGDAAFKDIWRKLLPIYFYRYDPRVGAAMDEVMAYSAAAYNHGSFTLAPGVNTQPWLAGLQVPTLVMSGAHDWLMPFSHAGARLLAASPQSEHAIFEESGHFPFIEEPVAFCNVLRRFIRQVAPP